MMRIIQKSGAKKMKINNNEWTEYSLEDLLSYEQPTPYIVESTDYSDNYKTPVLTAGKSFIIGYTNETDGIYDKLPVIIFDDFTTSTQYVNFPFKVKSSAMKILTANTNFVLPKFIFYRMQIIEFDHSTHKRYWIQQYSKIKVKIPSLPEQEKIVAKIEELFSELDNGVETLKKTKQQLAVYRQAVLKEAFSSCTKTVTVESVCQHVTDGDHMPPPKTKDGIPFIMISNIDNHIIDWSNTAFVGDEYYNNIDDKRRPSKGDVLYTVTGSYGIPVLIDFEKKFCFQRHIALLRPKNNINQKFLYYAMQEPGVYSQATKGATGTAQKTVGLAVLRKIQIPFCDDVDTQIEIVNDIEAKMSLCDSIEKTVDTALQQAEAMRQSILKKAFEGDL